MKLLVAYQPGSEGETLATDLRRAGLPDDVDALVLSVADVLLVPPAADAGALPPVVMRARQQAERAIAQAQQAAADEGQRLGAVFPSWRIRTDACADSPAWAIVKTAEALLPDLIVVGSHNHSVLGRLVLGSVAQRVLAEARCSVRIARPTHAAPGAPVRLLVGIDGSAGADAAVYSVARRKWPPASEARLVAVLDPTLTGAVAASGVNSDVKAGVGGFVDDAVAMLATAGLLTSTEVSPGDPKRVLVDEAERWGADCIFVGASGLRGFDRFVIGSVSTAVATRARCAVEVVRAAAAG